MKDHYLQVGGESFKAGIFLEPQKTGLRSGSEPKDGLISHGGFRRRFLCIQIRGRKVEMP